MRIDRMPESPQPSTPSFTGRQLVLLAPRAGRDEAARLHKWAGIRIAFSGELDGCPGAPGLATGEGVLFERLGMGLLRCDPDQSRALARRAGEAVFAMQAERRVRASALARPGARGPSSDTACVAWGLEATGV